MKKTFSLLLAAGFLMCFAAGCGDKETSGSLSAENSNISEGNGSSPEEKIEEANFAASSLENAGSSAMLELETDLNEDLSGIYWLTGKSIGAKGETLSYGDEMKIKNIDKFSEYMEKYFPDIAELEEAGILFVNGIAYGTYTKTSDGYFGTCPFGLITTENFDFDMTVEDCVKLIEGTMGEH